MVLLALALFLATVGTGHAQAPRKSGEAPGHRSGHALVKTIASQDVVGAPYPASKFIQGVTFSDLSMDGLTSGDQWAMTWADDGHIYAAWGDGTGFGYRGPFSDPATASIGVARVEGTPLSHRGINLWGGHQPESSQKSVLGKPGGGLLCMSGTLHLFITKQGTWDQCNLWTSADHGLTWKDAGVVFKEKDTKLFANAYLVQYGRDYTGIPARHEPYVYWHAQKTADTNSSLAQNNKDMLLARLPKDKLADRATFEFFSGTAESPAWSPKLTDARPVFHDPKGVNWQIHCVYDAGLQRYLLLLKHRYGEKSLDSLGFGLFEAPEPWGPRHTVYYTDRMGDFIPGMQMGISFTFPTKWISGDGRELWMVFSGRPSNPCDSFNLVKLTLTVENLKETK